MGRLRSLFVFVCFVGHPSLGFSEAKPIPDSKKSVVETMETGESDAKDQTEQPVSEGEADATDSESERQNEVLLREIEALKQRLQDLEQQARRNQQAAVDQEQRVDNLVNETEDIWAESHSLKKGIDDLYTHPNAGYDNGFFIASDNEQFRLTVNGFVQPFYRLVLQDTGSPADWEDIGRTADNRLGKGVSIWENGFGVQNARMITEIRAVKLLTALVEIHTGSYNEHLQRIQESSLAGVDREGGEYRLRILDAYGEYRPHSVLRIRAGQFKAPFDLETRFRANDRLFSSSSLMTLRHLAFADSKYLASEEHFGTPYTSLRGSSFERDVGAQVAGSVRHGFFNYAFGIFNGSGTNIENDNRDVLIAARFSLEPLGQMTPLMSDLKQVTRPLLSVGVGVAYDLLSQKSQFDSGYQYNSAEANVTGDVHFKWRGAALMAGLFYRYADHGSAVFELEVNENGETVLKDRPIRTLGLMGQLAYFQRETGLEPAIRYSLYDAKLVLRDDHVHEITAGLGFHVILHRLKVLAEYRGILPSDNHRSYLMPLGTFLGSRHEMTIMGQVSF